MATQSDSADRQSGGQDESDGTTRTSAKKAGARKTTAKKAPAKKSGTRKTSGGSGDGSATRAKKMSALAVARSAAQQLAELTGRAPESVIGIERSDDGWTVELEVVESRRIPDSTDILATYRVEVDEDGDLQGYHRVERYVRGKSARGDGGR